jgi:serpin B
MKKLVLIILLAVTLAILPGCAANSPNPAAVILGQEIKSDKPRVTSPDSSASDLAALVEGNNAFALDLYQILSKNEGNMFYSPYSLSEALAMTYVGARGTTETDMAKALDFTLAQDKLHSAFNALDLQLKQRGQGAQGADGKGFRLNVVNAIWGQTGYDFLVAYLDILAQNYGAGLRGVDFINQAEKSRVAINDWVSEQTEGKIKDLIPEGAVNELTRLVLTNAIYFNAAWAKQFNKDATKDGTFHTLNDGDVTAAFMHQTGSFKYVEVTNYQAIEITNDGYQLSKVVLLPASFQFSYF